MSTYTVGNLVNGPYYYTRWLYRDGEKIVKVKSENGPAVIGEMTEQQARDRFPEAFTPKNKRKPT